MRLGVGTGWNHVEYESLGEDFASRGKRFDEQVELLRKLWRNPVIDFRGDYHRVDRAGILPLPRPNLPIWFGGFSEVAVRRAARLGDGFIFGTTPTRMRALLATLHEHLRGVGREPAEFGAEAIADFSDDPDQWVREREVWEQCGGTHLTLRAMDTAAEFVGARRVGFDGPQAYIDALETFRKAI